MDVGYWLLSGTRKYHVNAQLMQSKIWSEVKEMISNVMEFNPKLTPSQIAKERGAHADIIVRLSHEVKKA